jgi:DNA mismatch repair protein MutL
MQERLAAFFKGDPLPQQAPAALLPLPPGIPQQREGKGRGEGAHEAWPLHSLPEQHSFEILSTPAPIAPLPSPGVPGEGAQSGVKRGALQLHNTYLVAESDDGLVIIDQHALHERIMFEELLARVTRGPLESQRLLIPVTLPASSRQIAMLEQIQPLLARLGMEITPFGPNAVALHAFPSFLERLDHSEFVRELLERGEQELLDLHEEELLHEILDMMSCKAAVKAGDALTAGEIEALLTRRELVERSSNCPHGRPTTLRLTLRDLEKQFKRTGF